MGLTLSLPTPSLSVCWQINTFGDPFFLAVKEGETLVFVKKRIQDKLQIADEEFAKVRACVCVCVRVCVYEFVCVCV